MLPFAEIDMRDRSAGIDQYNAAKTYLSGEPSSRKTGGRLSPKAR